MSGRPASPPGQLIETRWDGGHIRVWFPRRLYRPETRVRLTRREAEALVRNLTRRLEEHPETADGGQPA
jgi:hypothetical protein